MMLNDKLLKEAPMTVDSALKIAEAFDFNAPASEDDIFEFTEAMNFLITEGRD